MTMGQKVSDVPSNREGKRMSIAALSERLVEETMIEQGVKKPEARRIVAREAGIAPGALERLASNRLVHVERIADRISAYVIRRIEKKMAQLECELEAAKRAAARPDDARIFAAMSALDEAKRLMRGEDKPVD